MSISPCLSSARNRTAVRLHQLHRHAGAGKLDVGGVGRGSSLQRTDQPVALARSEVERFVERCRMLELPNGQFAVTPDMGAAWVEMLPVSRCHGVGPVTAARMKRLGGETGADLRARSLPFLEQHFGNSAGWYHAIARGVDHRPMNPNRQRTSSGSETTFDRDPTEPTDIEAGVLRMADDVWQITRTRSHAEAVADHGFLRRMSLDLVRAIYPPDTGIRLVGVTFSNFEAPVRQAKPELPLLDFA